MKLLKMSVLLIMFCLLDRHDIIAKGSTTEDAKKDKIIVFDFAKKRFMDIDNPDIPKSPKPYYFNYQDNVTIKVDNINLNKYEVTLDTMRRTYRYAAAEEIIKVATEEGISQQDAEEANKAIWKGMGLKQKLSLDDSIGLMVRYVQSTFDISKYDLLKKELEILVSLDLTNDQAGKFRKGHLDDFQVKKQEVSQEFKRFKKRYELFKENSKKNLTLEKLGSIEAALSIAEKNIKVLDEISGLFESLKAENFWTLFNLTNIEDDLIIIKLTIKEKSDKEGKGEIYSTSIKVKGKWKIDASAGALFNFGSYDHSYFINDQNEVYRGQSRQKVTPVYPVVLMHFYKKGEGQFSHGVSGGFGLTQDTKATFYLGYSALWGENQRWVLTGGTSLLPVSRLKAQYTKGQNLSGENIPDEADLVEDVYQLGAFLSVTYNLSRKD